MKKMAARLEALGDELEKMGVEDARVRLYPALPEKQIAALEKKYKYRLPDALRAYYLSANGHAISWSTRDGSAIARSTILGLETHLGSGGAQPRGARAQASFFSNRLGEAERRALERYRVFERMYADSLILVPADAEAGEVPIYLLQYPDRLTKLDLPFSAYVDQLIDNKALLDWQEAHKERDRDAELISSFERSLALTRSLLGGAPPPARAPSAYQERLDDLVKRVKGNPKVDLVRHETYPAPPLDAFKKIEATFGRRLPDAMIDFYARVNGFKLLWRTKPDVTPAAAGVIDIPPLEEAFGGDHHAAMVDWDERVTYQTLWNDELQQSAPDDFRALKDKRVFDRHLGRNQVLVEVAPEGVGFFYYIDGGVLELDATFEDVINLVFDSGGVEYYPDLLRKDAPDGPFVREFEAKARILNPAFRAPARRSA